MSRGFEAPGLSDFPYDDTIAHRRPRISRSRIGVVAKVVTSAMINEHREQAR